MANFTKAELIEALSTRAAMPKRSAGVVLDALLSIIKDETEAGKTVALQGFGRFSIRARPARPGRNPRTGEPVEYAASRTLTFKASKPRP